ncbi:MAG TPA: cis-3-hydroxy-L-proline dehydratase [Vicinamibacterales bacterium]|nr:cis-3-hydroxy-L-proline dehydratase [Vicinamibacterales bacterium]
MKITRIDVYQLSYGLHDKTYAWSGGHSVSRFLTTLVKVSTDAGLSGFGEVCPLGASYMEAHSHGVPSGVREIAPSIIGQDPTKLRAINAAMDAALAGHLYVKSPIDVACWDILGQSLGAPIARLLGGAWVDAYPLYRAISQAEPQKMADDVQRYRAEGYRRFQLKVGGDPDVDIQRVLACRRVLQPGDVLVADANTGWLPHQALRVVQGIAGVDCYVEQPCATLPECLVVRDRTPQPMVLDELMTGPIPFIQAYEARAMDVINIKISRVGGLTRAKQMRDLCETLGIVMTIEDSWGGDVATAAIAHLAGSTRPEFLFTSTDFNSYIDVSVADDAPRRAEGRLAVPTSPGLGLHVDESRLPAPVLTMP